MRHIKIARKRFRLFRYQDHSYICCEACGHTWLWPRRDQRGRAPTTIRQISRAEMRHHVCRG